MTMHIVKLSVGTESLEDMAEWQATRRRVNKAETGKAEHFHTTRMVPKKRDEILDNGSIYWVIKGVIQVRQRIVDIRDATRSDGVRCCQIVLAKQLYPVRPTPRRAFQGWRYLDPADAPEDLSPQANDDLRKMPPAMRRDLAELCLI